MHSLGNNNSKRFLSVAVVALAMMMMVSQVTWARCICDPADTLCLDGCVNSTRDCIESCSDDGVHCFTSCINDHWPGTTFEDSADNNNNGVLQNTVSDAATSVPATSSDEEVVIPVGGVAAATTSTGDDTISPFLMSIFAGGKSSTTVPAVPLTNINGGEVSSTPTAGNILNTMSPISFETTHTTITSLVTVTPNASSSAVSSSFTNNNNTSHGLKNLVDPWVLTITGFFLLATTYYLV